MNLKQILLGCLAAGFALTATAASIHITGDTLWRSPQDPSPKKSGRLLATVNSPPKEAWGDWAVQAAEALKDELGVSAAADELKVRNVSIVPTGNVHVRLSQIYHGIDVRAKELAIHFRPDGTAYQVNGNFLPGVNLSIKPKTKRPDGGTLLIWVPNGALDGNDARLAWRTAAGRYWLYTDAQTGEKLGQERRQRNAKDDDLEYEFPRLYKHIFAIAPQARTNAFPSGVSCTISGVLPRTLWTNSEPCIVEVPGIKGDDGYYYLCGVNSHGREFAIWNMDGVVDIYSKDKERTAPLPTKEDMNSMARFTSADWGDFNPEAIAAAYHTITVMDYFEETFGRATYLGEDNTAARTCSFVCMANLDEKTGKIVGGAENAMFLSDVELTPKSSEPRHSGAMYFGYYGNGKCSFQVLDVTAHEFSHSIAECTAQFVYEGESGALDESFADIFGVGCEMLAQPSGPEYPESSPQTADWFLGEDTGEDVPIRDLMDPASDYCSYRQPKSYRDEHWADTFMYYLGDGGGVHINSGIQNRFFYLLHERIGLPAALQIAYLTVTGYCTAEVGFREVAKLWKDAAAQVAGMTVNGIEIPASAPADVAECWAGLLKQPAFAAQKSVNYVGIIEDLGLYVAVTTAKDTAGRTKVTFEISDSTGFRLSTKGVVASGKHATTIDCYLGKIKLDFAGDNVTGSWKISRLLLDGSTPSFTVKFTAFSRKPEFYSTIKTKGIPGYFVGQRVSLALVSYIDYTLGDSYKFTAKGLPKGLSINSRNGKISGVPKRPGAGTATITVKSKITGLSSTCKLGYRYAAAPAWTKGKFAAYVIKDATGRSAGYINVSAGAAGAITGKIKTGSKTWKFKKNGFNSAAADGSVFKVSVSRKKGKKTDKLSFSITEAGISGTATIGGVAYSFRGEKAIDLTLDREPVAGSDVYLIPAGVKTTVPVVVSSDAPYTLTAKYLPKGLALVKNGGKYSITGKAKTPGELKNMVQLTVKTYAVAKGRTFKFRFLVDNYHTTYIPLEDHYESFSVGITSDLVISGAIGCSVKGLPAGLKFDPKTGTVYGTATKAGDFLVTFTRKVGSGKKATTKTATTLFRVS